MKKLFSFLNMPKGSNPKSQQNLVAGKNKRPDAVRTTVRLNKQTIEFAKQLGNGEITKGIDMMATLLKTKLWYEQLTEYAKSNDCYENIKKIEELITDVLFPLGLVSEEAQKEKLKKCASERHQKAFWDFLKEYENIQLGAN